MAVQAVFMDEVFCVKSLRYAWAEDGTLLFALDCRDSDDAGSVMTFASLVKELKALCPWQLSNRVTIGLRHALAEVLTIYHAFECAAQPHHTLMLVSTPPEEYFEAAAAA
jgi:hypothetical protein